MILHLYPHSLQSHLPRIFFFDPTAIATDKLKSAEVFERPENVEANHTKGNRLVFNESTTSILKATKTQK